VIVKVADINGNSMPTGSTIDISAIDDGVDVPGLTGAKCSVASQASYTIANSLDPVFLKVDLKQCTSGDQFSVKVTTPNLKTVTPQSFPIVPSSVSISTGGLLANVNYPGSLPATNVLNSVTVTVADDSNSIPAGSIIAISADNDSSDVPGTTNSKCTVLTPSVAVTSLVASKSIDVTLSACTKGDKFTVTLIKPGTTASTQGTFTIQ
jgi:hypothetical protein